MLWRSCLAWMLCVVVSLVPACTTLTTKLYEGPKRPPSEVSVLSLESDRAGLRFIEIDRKELGGRSVAMLPGEHKVRVLLTYMKHFDSGFVRTQFKVRVRCVAMFESLAGRRYVLRPVVVQVEEVGLRESVVFEIMLEDEADRGTPIGETRCYY